MFLARAWRCEIRLHAVIERHDCTLTSYRIAAEASNGFLVAALQLLQPVSLTDSCLLSLLGLAPVGTRDSLKSTKRTESISYYCLGHDEGGSRFSKAYGQFRLSFLVDCTICRSECWLALRMRCNCCWLKEAERKHRPSAVSRNNCTVKFCSARFDCITCRLLRCFTWRTATKKG